MKSLIRAFVVVFSILLTNFSFSQVAVARVSSAQELQGIKTTGKCVITLPVAFTKAEVADRSKYYTLYFTVDYNEQSREATITMVENSARSRQIIERFLIACDVESVLVGDEVVHHGELFEKYLNN